MIKVYLYHFAFDSIFKALTYDLASLLEVVCIVQCRLETHPATFFAVSG